MSSDDSALKRYIRSIGCEIPSGKMRKRIILQIRDSIFAYIQENPEADVETVRSHFGTPEEIAASYLYAQETPVLLRKMSTNRRILAIVAGVMAVVLVLWIGVIAWLTLDARKTNLGQVAVSTESGLNINTLDSGEKIR